MLFSSTTTPGQTSAMSSSLVTSCPWRLTSASRISKARWPIVTGTPWARSSRRATSKRNGPNAKTSLIGVAPAVREPKGQPIAAVATLVIHAARKAAHQVDAEVADLRLLERGRRRWRWRAGGVELPAVILDAGDERCAVPLELDCDFERTVLRAAVHDDVRDGLL